MNDFLTLVTTPSDNIWGTIAATHDDIAAAADSAEEGAQAESVANQGYKSDTECAHSYTDEDTGDVICDDEQIITPGNVVDSEMQDAIQSQYDDVVNADDLDDLNTEVADGMATQLTDHSNQGLYSLNFTTGNSLNQALCNYLGAGSSVSSIQGKGAGNNPLQAACKSSIGNVVNDFNVFVSKVGQYTQMADKIFNLVQSLF
jgi:hypothetical protein